MSTEQTYVLVADKAHAALVQGSDDRVFYIDLLAPPAELAELAAHLDSSQIRFLHNRLSLDEESEAAHPPLYLRVDGDWLALRQLLLQRWSLDLADHPVALLTESKYTISYTSPAADVIRKLHRRALRWPALAEVRSKEIHRDWRSEEADADPALSFWFDFFNWPLAISQGSEELLLSALPDLAQAIKQNPQRWDDLHWQSNNLFAQLVTSSLPRPDVLGSDWNPTGDWDYPRLAGGSDLPGEDPGLDRWREHDIRLSADAWKIKLPTPLSKLLKIPMLDIAYGDTPEIPEPSVYDEVADIVAEHGYLPQQCWARAFLIDRKHRVVFYAAAGVVMSDSSVSHHAWPLLAVVISPARVVQAHELDDVAALATYPWNIDPRHADVSYELWPLVGRKSGEMHVKQGLLNVPFRLSGGGKKPKKHSSEPAAPIEIIDLNIDHWRRRRFKLEANTGSRALDLALLNMSHQRTWMLEQEDDYKMTARERKQLERDAALAQSLREDLPAVSWTLNESSEPPQFVLHAAWPAKEGRAAGEIHYTLPVKIVTGESRAGALTWAQRWSVNNSGDTLTKQVSEAFDIKDTKNLIKRRLESF